MVKIFTDLTHFEGIQREHLIDLLKPFQKKNKESLESLQKRYGQWVGHVSFVDDPSVADLVVLPMSWDFYFKTKSVKEALGLIEAARSVVPSLPVLTFTTGDFGVSPPLQNVTIIRASGYANRRLPGQLAKPVFFSDPVARFFGRNEIFIREISQVPNIGFCGFADSNIVKYAKLVSKTVLRNVLYYTGLAKENPQQVTPGILIRERVLRKLETSPGLSTQFIRRNKYRAGAIDPEAVFRTSLEYYHNIRDTDYTVCVRGGGNFSVRLYETLAMGRIPIFVNTDCILPFDELINWRDHVVWVEYNEISAVGEIVREFHKSLSEERFRALQISNRNLWEKYLSSDGFWNTYLTSYVKPV